MRFLMTAGLVALLALTLGGCPQGLQPGGNGNTNDNTGGGGGGGSGNDNSDDNGNDNEDNGNDNDDNDDSGNDNTNDNSNDNDDSDELPVAFRLDGVWDDNGRHVIIEQNGTEVEANYFTERYCHPEDGPSEEPASGAESSFFDFRGTLNNGEDVLPGDIITGEVNTCRWGFETGSTGFVLADFTLTVIDENTLSGEYEIDEDGDGEGDPGLFGSFTVTREQ